MPDAHELQKVRLAYVKTLSLQPCGPTGILLDTIYVVPAQEKCTVPSAEHQLQRRTCAGLTESPVVSAHCQTLPS